MVIMQGHLIQIGSGIIQTTFAKIHVSRRRIYQHNGYVYVPEKSYANVDLCDAL